MRSTLPLCFLVACLVALIGACGEAGNTQLPQQEPVSAVPVLEPVPVATERFQAVTFDARRETDQATLERLADLGVTHLTLTTFAFQRGHDVPDFRMHTDGDWYSESDRGIRHITARVEPLGMQVIIKPHIWIGHYSSEGQTRDYIGFDTDEKWHQWETAYTEFILHYARLSEEIDAPLFVIGTELANVARTRPDFWRQLIAEVRAVYSGKLTYAANWWEEYEHIAFWDALDYIGVQGYFELTDTDDPPVDTLRAGWVPHREALQTLARETNRPILFTEVGYRSVHYAAAEPWRWPSRDERGTVEPDYELQARLYEAFFQSLWEQPWFAGAILWKWHPEADGRSERRTLDFSPQFKPAEAVIARWFGEEPARQNE